MEKFCWCFDIKKLYVILYMGKPIYGESEDGMLALKDTIKTIAKDKKVTQLEMAGILGISKQNFSNKIQRNTFSPDELAKLADALGMEIAFIDKDAEIQNGTKYVIVGAD